MERLNAASYFVDRHINEGRGNAIAIECGDEIVTYGELAERVNQLGNHLRDLGVKRGDRVLLLLHDTPAFAKSFFGAIKIGAVPVPLNTLLMPEDYEFIIRDSGARIAIVDESLLRAFHSAAARAGLRHLIAPVSGPISAASSVLSAEPTGRDDIAFWLYSSGSTGAPKACVHLQHDMIVCSEHYAKNILGMREADRCFSVSKLFFAYGLGNALYYPLAVGATSILMPGPPKPHAVFQVIERHRPTLFFSVPSNYAALMDHERGDSAGAGDFDLSSIRHCVSAGEALPAALFHRFKERFSHEILDGIGSTEALQAFITNRPGDVRPGASGKVIPGYEAKILNSQGMPAAPGEVGDLYIKNDAICDHYWNQPEKTAAAIKNGWLKTGDKYIQDDDGYFWYAGRADDMFKASGIWISPVEIENTLVEHPSVLEVAVVGKEDKDGLMKPVAYVIVKNGVTASDEFAVELGAFVKARLPIYKRPRSITFVKELPKTATGKIQRFKLRARSDS